MQVPTHTWRSTTTLRAVVLLLTLSVASPTVRAQEVPGGGAAAADRWELRFTGFRNPATGLELRRSRVSIFTGHYPTILEPVGGGEARDTRWWRSGVAVWSDADGSAWYAGASWLRSGQREWRDAVLVDVGGRWLVHERFAFRLGAAWLRSADGVSRFNPTVGFDVPLWRAR